MDGFARVVELVQALYSPLTHPSIQVSIQAELQLVQSSPEAWQVVPTLLQHPDPNVRFFAASTLAVTIESCTSSVLAVLARDMHTYVANSAARAFPLSAGPQAGDSSEKLCLRKLSAAAVGMSLRVVSLGKEAGEVSREWSESPDWLLGLVMRTAAVARREAVLEVLVVVFDVVSRAELRAADRSKYFANLAEGLPHVLSTVCDSLSSTSTSSLHTVRLALSLALTLASSTLLTSGHLGELYPHVLPHLSPSASTSSFIDASGEQEQVTSLACEVVESIIERTSGAGTSSSYQPQFMNRPRVEALVSSWVCQPYIAELLSQSEQLASEGDDPTSDGVLYPISRLVSTLAEHFISSFLFSPPPEGIPHLTLLSNDTHVLLSILLRIACFPTFDNYSFNELPAGAFMALQEESGDRGWTFGALAEANDGTDEAAKAVVKSVFESLGRGLRVRCRGPGTEKRQQWMKDERDTFRTYRNTSVEEVLLYTYYVLRDGLLAELVQLVRAQLDVLSHLEAGNTESLANAWDDLEASLHCIYLAHEAIVPSEPEQEVLRAFFSDRRLFVLLSTHATPAAARITTLKLLGAYGPVFLSLDATEGESSSLDAVKFIVGCLQQPDTQGQEGIIAAAAKAMRVLCDENRKQFVPHAMSFVEVLSGLEGRIEESEFCKIVQSAASVVQAMSPNEGLLSAVLALVSPLIINIGHSTATYASDPEQSRALTLLHLHRLSACARGLSHPDTELLELDDDGDDDEQELQRQQVQQLLTEGDGVAEVQSRLAQVVHEIAHRWPGDIEVVQALSDLVRDTTSTALRNTLTLPLPVLFDVASSAWVAHSSPGWLGVSTSLISRASREKGEERKQWAAAATQRVLDGVRGRLVTADALNAEPEVVRALTDYGLAVVRHFPDTWLLLDQAYLLEFLQLSELGIACQEKFAMTGCVNFLVAAVQQTRMASASSTLFAELLSPRLGSIITSAIVAIAGRSPRSQLTSLAELMHVLVLRMPDATRSTLNQVKEETNWPNERCTRAVKEKFEREMLKARTGKQARNAVMEFGMTARGLAGTAFGLTMLD